MGSLPSGWLLQAGEPVPPNPALLCLQTPPLPQVIFRFALALFKYKEEEILKLQDSMSIFKYLRYFTRTILDAR